MTTAMEPEEFGKLVLGVRTRMKLDIAAFAVAVGTHKSSVYRWEGGETRPRPQIVATITALASMSDAKLVTLGSTIAGLVAEAPMEALRRLTNAASAAARA